MPSSMAAASVASDVGTATISRRSPLRRRWAMRRVAKIAVLPVPSPMTMPDCTNSAAYSPACCLSALISMRALYAIGWKIFTTEYTGDDEGTGEAIWLRRSLTACRCRYDATFAAGMLLNIFTLCPLFSSVYSVADLFITCSMLLRAQRKRRVVQGRCEYAIVCGLIRNWRHLASKRSGDVQDIESGRDRHPRYCPCAKALNWRRRLALPVWTSAYKRRLTWARRMRGRFSMTPASSTALGDCRCAG